MRSGTEQLSLDVAEALLDYDARCAATDAADLIGGGIFPTLPEVVQIALADMTFNMGEGGVHGFVRMLAAMRAGDFALAAAEMLDSKWSKQVGKRATELAALVHSAASGLSDEDREQILAKVGLSLWNLAGEDMGPLNDPEPEAA